MASPNARGIFEQEGKRHELGAVASFSDAFEVASKVLTDPNDQLDSWIVGFMLRLWVEVGGILAG
ncbi:MAG: hypothetical protein ACYDHP_13560 [Ferrimicrobium sp.]